MGTAPDTIKRLIEHFDRQSDQVRSPDYNETQLRIDFINPLFAELGWDMDNHQRFAEQYREVVHEDRVKVAGQTKAPDYSFRVGGTRKFFLEAKKPSVNIKDDVDPAYQLRRYGWSAKLGVSLLTDFEEFAVYDCRIAPKHLEKAATARREYFTCEHYVDRWDFLEETFSKRAVLQGDFDRYCETTKGRGRQEFDDTFLEEIEDWRLKLAGNLALRNEQLNEADINFAVQRIIDRIIFLRMAEDRGTENPMQLEALLSGGNTYARLQTIFRAADARYNSGLFHFEKEKDRDETPDTLTPTLDIDDKTLKDIIRRLYYPQSPYEFTVVTADILGSVYERFLGKVITLTTGHRAKIEEKPEVRKAGGVYYTPTYIVDYIVKNTVGKLLPPIAPGSAGVPFPGQTPAKPGANGTDISPNGAAKIKILDPACGSGSFLIGAYQYLLDWHLQYYLANNPEKLATGKSPVLRPSPTGGYQLTIAERKRILLDNIHGVDLDSAAVEVTKLNLLLKCLEGETSQTLGFGQRLFRQRALPDLGHNILCGNSLIGTDIMATEAWRKMSDKERRRINPFDYERAFPRVFKQGGFDAVIGNPPYIRIQTLGEFSSASVGHLSLNYEAAKHGNYDIYVVFVERALGVLSKRGQVGFILPHKFFNAAYGVGLRGLVAEGRHLSSIVNFGDAQIFDSATTYCCLLFLAQAPQDAFTVWFAQDIADWRAGNAAPPTEIGAELVTINDWNFKSSLPAKVLGKLAASPLRMEQIASRIAQGIRTSANEIYVLEIIERQGDSWRAHSEALSKEVEIECGVARRFLGGRDIKRFLELSPTKIVLMPYQLRNGRASIIPATDISKEFPLAWDYLLSNRRALEARENGKMRGPNWYGYVYPKNLEIMLSPKLLVPDIADRAQFALDASGEFAFASGYGITIKTDSGFLPQELLGLLNSRLLSFCIREISTPLRGGFFRYFTQFIEKLPIQNPSLAERKELLRLVGAMLNLNKRLTTESHPHRQEQLQREIDATDRQIDKLVYELYGLSEDEIRIVEEATK